MRVIRGLTLEADELLLDVLFSIAEESLPSATCFSPAPSTEPPLAILHASLLCNLVRGRTHKFNINNTCTCIRYDTRQGIAYIYHARVPHAIHSLHVRQHNTEP